MFVDSRKLKDNLLNFNGQKLLQLFKDLSLVLLNGRSMGDEEGECKFIGNMGCSIIYKVAVSVNCLSLLSNFKALNFPLSEHMPVELSVAVGTSLPGKRERNHSHCFPN